MCSMEWDHIEAVAEGGEDRCDNLHLISAGLNSAVGDDNTREWALVNGHGTLKVTPPSANELAVSLREKWWNGRDITTEGDIRLDRAHIQVCVPWEGVERAIKHKLKLTGQPMLHFPRAAPAASAPVSADLTCQKSGCAVLVRDASLAAIPGTSLPAGRGLFCQEHGTEHLERLKRNRDRKARKAALAATKGN